MGDRISIKFKTEDDCGCIEIITSNDKHYAERCDKHKEEYPQVGDDD